MDTGILYTREYGSIRLHLRELMDRQGINRNQMARRINTRFEVVDKWYGGNVEKLDLDVLARLCFVLSCRVEDILEYTANDDMGPPSQQT